MSHFYFIFLKITHIVKRGFIRVYLFFLFLLENIDCGYTLEPPRRGGSNVYPQSMFPSKNKKGEAVLTCTHNLCFRAKIRKISNCFSTENFHFLQSLKSLCIAWASFRNVTHMTLVAWVVLVKFDRFYVSQHQTQNTAPSLQYRVLQAAE